MIKGSESEVTNLGWLVMIKHVADALTDLKKVQAKASLRCLRDANYPTSFDARTADRQTQV